MRKALQRQWHLPLAGVALMLALGQSPGLAATIPVGANCTLVNAITAANTDTATGGCPAGSGADTIVLPAGSTQTLTTVNNSTYGPTGLPVISSAITIAGQGSTIRRDSGVPEFRILAIGNIGDLMMQDSIISGGVAPDDAGVHSYAGGGVLNVNGVFNLARSRILNSIASLGGGIANYGIVTVTTSIIAGNTAFIRGGAIANYGTLTVATSVIGKKQGARSWRWNFTQFSWWHPSCNEQHHLREYCQRRWRSEPLSIGV